MSSGRRSTSDAPGGGAADFVESASGRLLGTVASDSTRPLIREGAVHIHQGDMYVVDRLDLTAACGTGSQPLGKRAAVTVLDTVPAQPGLPT
jgi:hypothetical protein